MEENVDVKEEARLKYRYVDLRRPHMQRNIILRSKMAFAVREDADQAGISRNRDAVHDALDSGRRARLSGAEPRESREVLCAAAIAADFQAAVDGERDSTNISRSCAVSAMRILRADRQAEFTQIDLEMSFPQQETIFEVIEPLIAAVCKVAGYDVPAPFPRLTYAQAMRSYGIDKPDLRIPPFHCVEDLFPERRIDTPKDCRWWRFAFRRSARSAARSATS